MTVNDVITARLLEVINTSGALPWQKPWQVVAFKNAVSKRAYRGINVLLLSALGKGEWYLTPKQVKAAGGNIKAGSKCVPIVFWKPPQVFTNANGDSEVLDHWIMRYYQVVSLEDTENVSLKLPQAQGLEFQPVEMAEKLAQALGAEIQFGGNRACIAKRMDGKLEFCMPKPEQFKSVAEYYVTLFHEAMHWIGLQHFSVDWSNYGSESYSKEELIAEIGANFLASYCGIDTSGCFDNSAAYVKGWAEKMGRDSRLIVGAAQNAQKRFDWLLNKAGLKVQSPELE